VTLERVEDFKSLELQICSVESDIQARCSVFFRAVSRLLPVWKTLLCVQVNLRSRRFFRCEAWLLTRRPRVVEL
jgi:hypothetical protein